ncbi:hypothetical protein EMCG_03629 [[Emmonsia] crescens]|uniref:Uncharacterized protein n=1 Tax=[Emmonsia] crescens TaxID=73230 RepID=A0A0G2HVQ2_9EURO|nr:hypothetical protein EMCG_03629 [Emmonsia crescens UAMH 3008]
MSAITNHLVRRGLEATSHLSPITNNDNEDRRQLSGWAMLVFGVTAVVFGLIAFAIQYTYGTLVAVLAAVEDPHPDIYEPIKDPNDPNKTANMVGSGPNSPLERPAPVTRSLRATILHLRARAGPWSRFRGLGMYLCLGICRSVLAQLFTFGHGSTLINPVYSLGHIAADIVSATLELAWVHIVISEPSAKPFWRRIPGYSSWVKIAPAVALRSVASQLTLILPAQLGLGAHAWRMEEGNPFSDPDYNPRAEIIRAIATILLAICLTVLIELPATVTMIRVAASILSEEEETIVPFDRTFAGKVQPAILGGSGKIGLLDAWKTFTWPSRIRLLKVLVKTFGMLIAVTTTCGVFFAAESMLLGENTFVKT